MISCYSGRPEIHTLSLSLSLSVAWQQHDVQELCRVMFDALEKRFKKDKHTEADLINHLYQGTLKDYVKCLKVRETLTNTWLVIIVSLSLFPVWL